MKKLHLPIIALFTLAIQTANAQVKIGSNPATITANTNLDVEATDGTRLVVTKPTGNVGIGTNTPFHRFHVAGGYSRLEYSPGPFMDFMHSGAGVDLKIRRIGSLNGDMIFDKVNDAYSTSTEHMRINSSGRVWIGTSPNYGGFPGRLTIESILSNGDNSGIYVTTPASTSVDVSRGIGSLVSGVQTGPLTGGGGNRHYIGTEGAIYDLNGENLTGRLGIIRQVGNFAAGLEGSAQAPNRTDGIVTGIYASNFSALSNQWALVAYGRTFSSSGVWTASDRSFKKDVQTLQGALGNVIKMNLVSYHYDPNSKYYKTMAFSASPELQYGVIAQELEAIYPEMIGRDGFGNRLVKYEALIPVSLKAIQELNNKVDDLTQKVAALEAMVKKLANK